MEEAEIAGQVGSPALLIPLDIPLCHQLPGKRTKVNCRINTLACIDLQRVFVIGSSGLLLGEPVCLCSNLSNDLIFLWTALHYCLQAKTSLI